MARARGQDSRTTENRCQRLLPIHWDPFEYEVNCARKLMPGQRHFLNLPVPRTDVLASSQALSPHQALPAQC